MCINPITIKDPNGEGTIKVKCGKCILCRRNKCRDWAIRLYHESQYHKKMCMVTLTFRPKFLLRPKIKELKKTLIRKMPDGTKKKKTIKYKTMISPSYITDVNKTSWLITLFIKKLRKELSKQGKFISYFAVGEHGSQNTHRAHWHILFFDIDKNDLNGINIGKSKKNKDIYWSQLIDELWSYDKMKIGQHTISDVTTATIKYVANYTMKKMWKNPDTEKAYPTKMRFSNQNKFGLKWARRYHHELRKGYILDNEQIKYKIPEGYYREMIRYAHDPTNLDMDETAQILEQNKIDTINYLMDNGMLSEEEIKKKAKKLENRIKGENRDTF